MDEINKINLPKQTKFQSDEISKIENYFIEDINQRKSQCQKLNKYITTFDYIDQILIVLNATSGGGSIISFVSVIGASVGIVSARFTLIFYLATGIVNKLLDITRNKRKKHDKILMLAKSKANSIDTLISQKLIDMDICHEEFVIILREKDRYEMIKEN